MKPTMTPSEAKHELSKHIRPGYRITETTSGENTTFFLWSHKARIVGGIAVSRDIIGGSNVTIPMDGYEAQAWHESDAMQAANEVVKTLQLLPS